VNNIHNSKELIKLADDGRHRDRVKGNFAVTGFICSGVAILNGVTSIPPDRNMTGLELPSSGKTNLPSGAVILTRVPISDTKSID
jgi:hypothetical protein